MTPAEELTRAALALEQRGLNSGTSGNASVRTDGGFLVTPSALPAERLEPAAMVELGLDGTIRSGGVPSTEWRIHRDVYRAFRRAGAVVHTHSPYATALAALREDLPAFHYLVGKAGGHVVRCAAYATFGSQELSDAVVEGLGDRRACLMANHGALAYGADLDSALALATEVEVLARQYLIARSAGTPVLLTAAQMDAAIARFAHYEGQDDSKE
jgi:L-fuculose-phosphate aldolase